MQLTRIAPGLAVAALLALAGPAPALAYPQFQLSTGNVRCNLCHVAPAGGGLINDYGRDEAEGSVSFTAGSSRFVHGLFELPEWLAIGGDYRSATVLKHTAGHNQFAFFPMQADLYTRLVFGPISVNTIIGVRGAAREPKPSGLERVGSREHYVMWQPEETGPYARVGRFFAPFGLRLQDHTSYLRRYLGQHTFEETYNLSGGMIDDAWEVHGTLFASPTYLHRLVRAVGTQSIGAALYYERRAREDKAAYGVQSKVQISDDTRDAWLGGIGKLWLEDQRVLVLGELDLGVQRFAFDADPRLQLAGYLGATYVFTQGVYLGAAYERYDADVLLSDISRDSVSVTAQFFFRSHWELMALGKIDLQAGGSPDPLAMLMLHYYL